MKECVFCRIARGESPARVVYEDETVVAFHDRNPKAPVHVLVVPRKHYTNLLELTEDGSLLEGLLRAVKGVARDTGIETGFRCVINTGPKAGQTVGHLHIHVMGGRFMSWPPG